MGAKSLSSMEIDAIGEILNISLGASATAVSTMLDARVDITTPVVQVRSKEEFEFTNLEPAVGVEITYVDGLTGSNLMLLKRLDVKVIVEMLMGMEIDDDEFELNEMNISAICEVMNQMMGASSTALSELLSKTVNISTPVSFEVESTQQFKDKYFEEDVPMVVIGFTLRIADRLESEFMNLMPIELAKELVAGFFPEGVPEEEALDAEPAEEPVLSMPEDTAEEDAEEDSGSGSMMSEDEIQKALALYTSGSSEPAEEPQAAPVIQPEPQMAQQTVQQTVQPVPQAVSQPVVQDVQPIPQAVNPVPQTVQPVQQIVQPAQDSALVQQMAQMMEMMQKQMQMQQQQMQQMQNAPKQIKVNSVPQPNLMEDNIEISPEANMDLIMGVSLEVSVEIGRTRKLVKDILDFNKGTLVVLDKLAGEQVDLFVNGQCIAKGDVVVVEDNFGIRITEILQEKIVLGE